MVNTFLTENSLQEGENLLEVLDENGLNVRAALWLYMQEAELWRYILSVEELEKKGPKHSYELMQKIINDNKNPDTPLPQLDEIKLVKYDEELLTILRRIVRTESKSIACLRVKNNMIDGYFIADALIYRLT